MIATSLRSCVWLFAFLICSLLFACSEHNQATPSAFSVQLNTNQEAAKLWRDYSRAYFLHQPATLSTSDFTQVLDAIMVAVEQQNTDNFWLLKADAKFLSEISSVYILPNDNPAVKERKIKRLKLSLLFELLSFQLASIGTSEHALINSSAIFTHYLDELKPLIAAEPVLNTGSFEIYEYNDELSLFALKRELGKRRAYIAFNLSHDIQNMPLPFGFMSSTKVSVWRTDLPELKTFVTNEQIEILPFTAIIVLVG